MYRIYISLKEKYGTSTPQNPYILRLYALFEVYRI